MEWLSNGEVVLATKNTKSTKFLENGGLWHSRRAAASDATTTIFLALFAFRCRIAVDGLF